MSGRLPRALFLTPAPGGARLLSAAEARRRLSWALALSLIAHAVVVLVPSHGTGARSERAGFALSPAGAGSRPSLDVRIERPSPAAAASGPRGNAAAPGVALRLSRGLEKLPVPPVEYFPTDRLTKRPVPLSAPAFDTPRKAARFANGTIVLVLRINDAGGVDAADVEKSSLPYMYSYAAAEAFRKLRFEPGEIDGRRVAVLMRIEVAYRNSTWR